MKRFVAFLAMTAALTTAAQDKPFAIAIHGGSGTITRTTLSPEREAAYRTVLTEALEAGRKVLAANGTSLDAVVAAVKIMEDSPATLCSSCTCGMARRRGATSRQWMPPSLRMATKAVKFSPTRSGATLIEKRRITPLSSSFFTRSCTAAVDNPTSVPTSA